MNIIRQRMPSAFERLADAVNLCWPSKYKKITEDLEKLRAEYLRNEYCNPYSIECPPDMEPYFVALIAYAMKAKRLLVILPYGRDRDRFVMALRGRDGTMTGSAIDQETGISAAVITDSDAVPECADEDMTDRYDWLRSDFAVIVNPGASVINGLVNDFDVVVVIGFDRSMYCSGEGTDFDEIDNSAVVHLNSDL